MTVRSLRQTLRDKLGGAPAPRALTPQDLRQHCEAIYSAASVHSLARNLTAQVLARSAGVAGFSGPVPTGILLSREEQARMQQIYPDHPNRYLVPRLNDALHGRDAPCRIVRATLLPTLQTEPVGSKIRVDSVKGKLEVMVWLKGTEDIRRRKPDTFQGAPGKR